MREILIFRCSVLVQRRSTSSCKCCTSHVNSFHVNFDKETHFFSPYSLHSLHFQSAPGHGLSIKTESHKLNGFENLFYNNSAQLPEPLLRKMNKSVFKCSSHELKHIFEKPTSQCYNNINMAACTGNGVQIPEGFLNLFYCTHVFPPWINRGH